MKPGKDRKNGFVKTDRTKSVKRRVKLRQEEDFYRNLVESTSDSLYLVDRTCKYLFINKPHLLRLGLTKEESIGRSYDEFHSAAGGREFAERVKKVIAMAESVQHEYRSERDGRYFLQTFSPVSEPGPDVRITGVAVVSKDITERKQAEDALQERELFFSGTLNDMLTFVAVLEPNGDIIFVNNTPLKIAGMNLEDVIGEKFYDTYWWKYSDEAKRTIREDIELASSGKIISHPIQVKTTEGLVWIEFSIHPIYDDKGKVKYIVPEGRDITERKRMEEALRESEELYKILAESSFAAVFIVQDGKFVFINTSAIDYAGYSAEEMIGHSSDMIVHPDDKELVRMKSREILAGRSNQAFEFRMVTKQNQIRWISQTVTPIVFGGNPAILGNAMDVTELKRATENLQAASKRMQDIIEFLPDPTFVIDEKKEVIAWNRAIEDMTGVLKKDMIGKGDYAYAVPFYGYPRPILIDLVECTDEEIKAKYDFVERKGNTIFAETQIPALRGAKDVFLFGKASPFFDAMGDFCGAIESIRNISEQKRTEKQLIYTSTHDELTGSYNRAFFDTEVDRFALGRHFPLSIIVADVDGLKPINDSQGHTMGDKLIQSAANVLKQSTRPDDILARIGGDEFAMLLPDTSETTTASIIERIKKNIGVFNETCNDFSLSLSLGAAEAKRGDSLSKVFEYADEAMYREKALQKERRK